MSKYTTEVRFICETKSGLTESTDASNVDTVIANSWNKIFTTKTYFFDETYRSVLCSKILKHYYLREICCETVGIWQLWMNTKLEEIMPYYNQLYDSARIKFNPMYDVDLTRKHDGNSKQDKTQTSDDTRKVSGNRDNSITSSGSRSTETSDNETNRNLFSDTPQGAITGIENETYLTDARKITDSKSGSGTENTNTTEKSGSDYTETENKTGNIDGTVNSTEAYVESISGKQGGGSFSSMLNEYRTTLLNIDMQVIKEFEDLFFGLW